MNPAVLSTPEFPDGASDPTGLSRKEFLRLMGASLALAGATACTRQPPELIVPYVRQPEGLTPGEPQWYASAMEHGDDAIGLLVKAQDGRPVKIEGNPLHPTSLGRTNVHAQAALLDLYDPDRSQTVRHRGLPDTWEDFLAALTTEQAQWKTTGGAGVRLLTGHSSSLLLHEQIGDFLTRYPQARWHYHDPLHPADRPRLRYDRYLAADLIVSLDRDFLGPDALPRDIALFAERRRKQPPPRLYVYESMPSVTGSMADHRYALSPTELAQMAVDLVKAIEANGEGASVSFRTLVHDLLAHRGRSLVLAGEHQPAQIQWAARRLNHLLGNEPEATSLLRTDLTNNRSNLATLIGDLAADKVEALIILDSNPAYTAPGDIAWPTLPDRVFSVHCGAYLEETAVHCEWHIPKSHFLESWGATRSLDGAVTIVQPLIEPLYPSKSQHEFLAALIGDATPIYEMLRKAPRLRELPETNWRKALHDGSVFANEADKLSGPGDDPPLQATPPAVSGLEVGIRPDPHLLDGRHANNAWLQELPRPITKLTWGNAIYLSPATARDNKLEHGDEVELVAGEHKLRGPVFVLPGHADRCATIHQGGGRTHAGRIGNGVGYNATALQTAASPWLCRDVQLRKTGGKQTFAVTQHQMQTEGREAVRVVAAGASKTSLSAHELDSLSPPVKYTSPSWGMVIDLNTCTGCGTCTIACQAENNIPVVGRAEVLRGRAMHWIRVDSYIEGTERPQFLHQPVPCMHCENAPCEVVCPVAATVHDHQGLNLMVYNRCVGTRYCSNNCPYKVRRFNFFQYNDEKTPQLKLQRNPEVTIRPRGVMEKCTYCVQRISRVQIAADVEKRAIRDGEVVPACAQACPAGAISFGDILDPKSKVAIARRDPRHYSLLEELNTRPRTTYLARVTNHNPEVAS